MEVLVIVKDKRRYVFLAFRNKFNVMTSKVIYLEAESVRCEVGSGNLPQSDSKTMLSIDLLCESKYQVKNILSIKVDQSEQQVTSKSQILKLRLTLL